MGEPSDRGPWIETRHGTWLLRLLIGADPIGGSIDVEIVDDSRTLTGTIGSIADVEEAMAHYRQSGECLSGRYFWTRNLLLVRETTEQALFDVLRDLIDTGEAFTALEEVGDSDA